MSQLPGKHSGGGSPPSLSNTRLVFRSDLSMNNITELPAFIFNTFPYLEEL